MSLTVGSDPVLYTFSLFVIVGFCTFLSVVYPLDSFNAWYNKSSTLKMEGRSASQLILIGSTLALHALGLTVMIVIWYANWFNSKDWFVLVTMIVTFVANVFCLLYKMYWTMRNDNLAFSVWRYGFYVVDKPKDITSMDRMGKGVVTATETMYYESFLTMIMYGTLIVLVLIPCIQQWTAFPGNNAASNASFDIEASSTRSFFTATACVLLAGVVIDIGMLYGRQGKVSNAKIDTIKSNLGIPLKRMAISPDTLAERYGDKMDKLPFSGDTKMPLADPATTMLLVASNLIDKTKHNIPGLSSKNFAIREMPTGEMYAFSPAAAHILDNMYSLTPDRAEHISGGGSIYFRDVSDTSKQEMTIKEDVDLSVMDSPPIFGSYKLPIYGVSPVTRGVMGFKSGLGIVLAGGVWRNYLITGYMLLVYLLILRNPTTATMAWCITVLPALAFSLAGQQSHFLELLYLQLFYGWAAIVAGQYVIVGGAASNYIHKTALWNDTSVWQANTTIANIDESFTATSLTYYMFACSVLYTLVMSIQGGCSRNQTTQEDKDERTILSQSKEEMEGVMRPSFKSTLTQRRQNMSQ